MPTPLPGQCQRSCGCRARGHGCGSAPSCARPVPQEPAFSTAQSRGKGMALVVALTLDGFARGDLFWDDGESWETSERGDYTEILFLASNVSTGSCWRGASGQGLLVALAHVCVLSGQQRGSRWGRAPGGALSARGVAERQGHTVPSLCPQDAVLSQLLRGSAHLDGVLLEAVTVLGVTSPPRRVLANGAIVSDFSYRSDTQVSVCSHPGKAWWPGRDLECGQGAGRVWPQRWHSTSHGCPSRGICGTRTVPGWDPARARIPLGFDIPGLPPGWLSPSLSPQVLRVPVSLPMWEQFVISWS